MIEFAIALVPLLLLLVALLLGRYPGCEATLRLAARLAAWSRPRTIAKAWRCPRRPAAPAVRGGLLLAFSLSGRAPPA